MPETHSAGETIASFCTKCKLGLDHTIVALKGATIAKVKCKTCGSTHKFRDPADAPKTKTPRANKSNGTKSSAEDRWEAGMAEGKGKARDYSMAAKYRVGDIVDHDHFGKGVVRKLYMNKCDVLFKDKERLMASAN